MRKEKILKENGKGENYTHTQTENRKNTITHVHVVSLGPLLLATDVCLDGLSDGQLASPLADLRQVSAGEPMRHLGQVVQVHTLTHQTKNG